MTDSQRGGYTLSSSVWPPLSVLQLCNVPFDANYRDIVSFDNETDKKNYFNSLMSDSITIENAIYIRPMSPIKVEIPYHIAQQYNYIIVNNYADAEATRTFYYFINDIVFLNASTTILNVQLDVWMTYGDLVNFGKCYVERGHIGIANENMQRLDGLAMRRYLEVSEGLDVGTSYVVGKQQYVDLGSSGYVILVLSTGDLTAQPGSVDNPKLTTAKGGYIDNMPSGASLYAIEPDDLTRVFEYLSNVPWVSQQIVSMTIFPKRVLGNGSGTSVTIGSVMVKDITAYKDRVGVTGGDLEIVENFNRSYYGIPDRYAHLVKFYTYPYAAITVSANNGNNLVLKPQNSGFKATNGNNASHVTLLRYNSAIALPSPRIQIYAADYNTKDGEVLTYNYQTPRNIAGAGKLYAGDNIDMALTIDNFPQFPTLNNGYLTAMASSAHSRQFAFESAEWGRSKSIQGIQLGYDQANKGLSAGRQLNASAQTAMDDRVMLGGANAAANVLGAASTLNPVAAATSLAGNAISKGQMNRDLDINQAVTEYNRDTNYTYANSVAQGDYENTIAGLNAKIQDTQMTPPSMAGQYGGDGFNMAAGFFGVLIKYKGLTLQAYHLIGEYWLRYGYAINEFMVPPRNLKCCEKFTYWKLKETYLLNTDIPELFKNTIRGIFESGVTVWSRPEYIGNTDMADNKRLEGIGY